MISYIIHLADISSVVTQAILEFLKISYITCRNFVNYDPKLFCKELNSVNFEDVYSSISVNEAWASLQDIVQRGTDKHAPLISKKVKGRLYLG